MNILRRDVTKNACYKRRYKLKRTPQREVRDLSAATRSPLAGIAGFEPAQCRSQSPVP